MNLDDWLQWIQVTTVATAIRENGTIFPWVEAVHVVGLTVVVGSIAIFDLRLLGWGSRDRPIRHVLRDTVACTWTGFAVAVVTGVLLFSSNAVTYSHNGFFRAKILGLLLLAANAAVFERLTARDIDVWDRAPTPPLKARLAGVFSLGLWAAVVICGRWIGFSRLTIQ